LRQAAFPVHNAFGQAPANPTQRPSPPRTETTALLGLSKDFPSSAGIGDLQAGGGDSTAT
jgi:hypothetical protein